MLEYENTSHYGLIWPMIAFSERQARCFLPQLSWHKIKVQTLLPYRINKNLNINIINPHTYPCFANKGLYSSY